MSREALYRFEAIAGLYYGRFRRLAPGKSEAIETGRDSNSDENREQFRAWRQSDQAFIDAIDRIVELDHKVAELECRLDNCNCDGNQ